MKKLLFGLLILFIFISCGATRNAGTGDKIIHTDSIPSSFLGNFMDDYGIRYTVTDTLWTQHSGINYHILQWNTTEQYILARNDSRNPGEANLYTRIDYMPFQNMAPFGWGFCLTVYDAKNIEEAKTKATADRQNPKKGCGGFPFSRMKRTD